MKKWVERLLVILFPLGMIYCMGKALFCRGDFVTFLGCVCIAVLSFVVGVIISYYNPEIMGSIDTFCRSIFPAVKVLFS